VPLLGCRARTNLITILLPLAPHPHPLEAIQTQTTRGPDVFGGHGVMFLCLLTHDRHALCLRIAVRFLFVSLVQVGQRTRYTPSCSTATTSHPFSASPTQRRPLFCRRTAGLRGFLGMLPARCSRASSAARALRSSSSRCLSAWVATREGGSGARCICWPRRNRQRSHCGAPSVSRGHVAQIIASPLSFLSTGQGPL